MDSARVNVQYVTNTPDHKKNRGKTRVDEAGQVSISDGEDNGYVL